MSILLKIVRFLNFGWAEFLLAMSPVLSTYSRGIIHLDMFSCIIVAMICFFRRQEKWAPGYYKFFVAFVICHELVLCYTMPSLEMYHINNLINMSVFLFTIMIVSPAIDFVKFTHATYFVAIILGIGILYQFRMLLSGNIISPLPVPVIDWFFDRDRGDNLSIRPMSFFEEPASYANYMIIPMFLLLRAKKYIWYGISVLFVLMSTSTTGVVSSFSLLIFNALLNIKHKFQFVVIVLMLSLVGYGMLNIEELSATKEKIENTDVEKNSRLMNGPYIYQHIEPFEYVTGINASNPNEYAKMHKHLYSGIITFGETDNFFVSNFWNILIKFGIIGFTLYYLIYFKLIKSDIVLLPLLGTEVAFSFFGGLGISSAFVYVMTTAIACGIYEKELQNC